MRIFAIRDESLSPDTVLGYLIYYERPKAFYIELPENAGEREETPEKECSLEAKLIEKMKEGASLREAQELLCAAGEKKNAVKQAALTLKKLFEP